MYAGNPIAQRANVKAVQYLSELAIFMPSQRYSPRTPSRFPGYSNTPAQAPVKARRFDRPGTAIAAVAILRRYAPVVSVVICPLLVVGAWEAVSRSNLFARSILVPPAQVFRTFHDLLADGELREAVDASFIRVICGFLLGSLTGLLVGVGLGVFPKLERYGSLLFHILRQVPIISLAPLLILVLGIGEGFKIALIATAAFFPVALNSLDGVRNVPRKYRDVAEVLRFSNYSIVRKVVLPGAMPAIVTGLRLGLSRSWMILVAAELFASSTGLGHMMDLGREMFQIDVVLVAVLVTGLIGFTLDCLLKAVESRLFVWKSAAA
jgi:sulfonate transport system permease protein